LKAKAPCDLEAVCSVCDLPECYLLADAEDPLVRSLVEEGLAEARERLEECCARGRTAS